MARHGEEGFSLLEAIVALALLSAALLPLYLLISAAAQSAGRLDRSNRQGEIELNALEVMYAVNPMERPDGRVDLGPYAVRWSARLALEPVDGSDYPAGRGRYRIGLYDSVVEAVEPGGRVLLRFPLRMVGFKQRTDESTRDPEPPQ
jgi:general secretion pathway protein I